MKFNNNKKCLKHSRDRENTTKNLNKTTRKYDNEKWETKKKRKTKRQKS